MVSATMGCVPFINEFNIMKWFLHFRNFITEVRHILQNVILSLLQLQYSTFTQYFFFFFSANEPIGNSMWVA